MDDGDRGVATRVLNDGKIGRFCVEDVVLDEAAGDPDLARMRELWELAAVPTASAYEEELAANGLRLLADHDYSEGFETSAPAALARLEARWRRIHSWVPHAGVRFVARAFLGGIALERLYRKGLVRYRLLVAERSS